MRKFFCLLLVLLILRFFIPIVLVQGQDPGVFIPFSQTIPREVMKTKNESMVSVRSSIYAWTNDLAISSRHFFGCGVTVLRNYVLTSLHIFGQNPALWRGNDQFPTRGVIFDGQSFFFAKIAFLDAQADLVLLKIETPNERGEIFVQQPARIAKTTTIIDPNSGEQRVLDKIFFAFSFYTDEPRFFYTISLGPYRAITNTLEQGNYLLYPMGVVQGAVQPGFSGGPLLSPDGLVMGIVDSTSNINTFVVTAETVHSFLNMARVHLGLDTEGKPVVLPPTTLLEDQNQEKK